MIRFICEYPLVNTFSKSVCITPAAWGAVAPAVVEAVAVAGDMHH